jgi:hypothetical protein
MFEFHGWCKIRDSASDPNPETIQVAAGKLAEFVAQLHWTTGFCRLQPFNGEYFFHMGGFQNRPLEVAAELDRLFERIAQEAPGSFGLLYLKDDEDPVWHNSWRVRVLARGVVRDSVDSFLSPCNPVIED